MKYVIQTGTGTLQNPTDVEEYDVERYAHHGAIGSAWSTMEVRYCSWAKIFCRGTLIMQLERDDFEQIRPLKPGATEYSGGRAVDDPKPTLEELRWRN